MPAYTRSRRSTRENERRIPLWQVGARVARIAAEALSGAGLTYMQFVLPACPGWLTRDREDIAQIQLAEVRKIDSMMISQVIRLMEKKRLVARREHPTDTRANSDEGASHRGGRRG